MENVSYCNVNKILIKRGYKYDNFYLLNFINKLTNYYQMNYKHVLLLNQLLFRGSSTETSF